MDERKQNMLEAALALFAKKGYHATSIQEITQAWGISKGAFYNNFSSKEELMFHILKFYSDLAFQEVQSVTEGETEKENFVAQICMQFSIIESHKEFIRMYLTEQPQQMTGELQRYMLEIRARDFRWYAKRLLEVYGAGIEKHVMDCVLLFISMMQGYISLMILDQKELPFDKTARFLVKRLDSIIVNLEDEPLLTREMMQGLWQEGEEQAGEMQECLAALRGTVSGEEQLAAVRTLEAELSRERPRMYMVDSLLLYLEKQMGDTALQGLKEAVAAAFASH
ncbi:TetR/AcrR family transcriptional regulator [Ectobacillus ponti]|uniref:TetR/AcrR family transcriptional regulator n=1 Tax=Ectobacillus ponti TaxID=2961894 RepID=UPI0020C90C45|nr:TetR/AcrR family transcriptional regulator [Ectobacillus ponti]